MNRVHTSAQARLWSVMVMLLSLLWLSPWLNPLRQFLLGFLAIEPTSHTWTDLIARTGLALVLTLASQRLTDYYLLLDKGEQKLHTALSLPLYLSLLLHSPRIDWAIPLVFLIGTSMLFSSYQSRQSASAYLFLGIGLGVGVILYAKTLLLLPLVLMIVYRQRTFYPKHIIALLHGIVLCALITFGIVGVGRSIDWGHSWLEQWNQWHALPLGLDNQGYAWGSFALALIFGAALSIYSLSDSSSSVRQSEQFMSLIYTLFFGIALSFWDSTAPFVFVALLPLPVSVFASRGIARIYSRRHQHIAVGCIMAGLLILLLFS